MSEKRRTALYKAIMDPIMDLRVTNSIASRGQPLTSEEIDKGLYDMENRIWRRVCAALELAGTKGGEA